MGEDGESRTSRHAMRFMPCRASTVHRRDKQSQPDLASRRDHEGVLEGQLRCGRDRRSRLLAARPGRRQRPDLLPPTRSIPDTGGSDRSCRRGRRRCVDRCEALRDRRSRCDDRLLPRQWGGARRPRPHRSALPLDRGESVRVRVSRLWPQHRVPDDRASRRRRRRVRGNERWSCSTRTASMVLVW